ncbi:glycosyl hydrolase family 18 protein [Oceanobacillus luteolus]|uniref:chitinase n=1 Tax=Oceanobacillus luteolus TaxID=1274358 RepID=A0ABW4HQ01_9BACI
MSRFFAKFFLFMTLVVGLVYLIATQSIGTAAESTNESPSYIDVTTIEEGGDTVEGSPVITAVPDPSKSVEQVIFYAKAVNEPESAYYPYAPIRDAPYSWSWPTGNPWVPDGEYRLRVDITYSTGEVETVTRDVIVNNYSEPNAPESPKDLTVVSRTDTSALLSWTASTTGKLYQYEIYQDGEKIAETTESEYHVEGLSADTLYQFRVKEIDIYNNTSIDDNTITILTDKQIDSLPETSEIHAPEPNGANPRDGGYAGTIELSVHAENDQVNHVEFYVKSYRDMNADYWEFPEVTSNEGTYTVAWDTTSAPEGNAIIKVVAYDANGQSTTSTRVLLVDNILDGYIPPNWEPAETPPANYMIAYLAGWSTLGNFDILRDLDASRLTHVNYAFGLIGDDLKIKMSDPVNDPENFAALNELKEVYPHLQTTIAIGGWGGSANFSEAAATEESREIFADSVVEFIVEYGFNGVDLDWEYPVTGGGPGTSPNPADRENFPLLLETLREKLDEQGERDNVHYTLSIAGAANAGFVENTQLGSSHEYLDYVQMMTYDIHGTWESLADFNAPLYDDDGQTWSVDRAVDAYLDAGVPAEKVVMGVPFYGYWYNVTSDENNGLRQPFEGSGSVTYNRFMQNDYLNNGYTRYWDEGTQVPYLFNEETSTFISYDDPESLTLKAEYIRERGLGGAMIWEISQDHGIDLLDSLYSVLKDPIQPHAEEAVITLDQTTLQQGAETVVELEVLLSNGESADLAEAEITWISSNAQAATVNHGVLTARNAGSTDIHAVVTYNDEEISTNVIHVTVEVTTASLIAQVTKLKEEGEMDHHTYKKLSNALKQTERHYEKGRIKQAIKHLDNFRKHLDRSNIDETSKTVLQNNADALEESIN